MHILDWFDELRRAARVAYPQATNVAPTVTVAKPGVFGLVAIFGEDPRVPVALLTTEHTPCSTTTQAVGTLASKFGRVLQAPDAELSQLDLLLGEHRAKFGERDALTVQMDDGHVMVACGPATDDGPDPALTRQWESDLPEGAVRGNVVFQHEFDRNLQALLASPETFPTVAELATEDAPEGDAPPDGQAPANRAERRRRKRHHG